MLSVGPGHPRMGDTNTRISEHGSFMLVSVKDPCTGN